MNGAIGIAEDMIDRAEANMPKVRRFDPDARQFEAFWTHLSKDCKSGTSLWPPLAATTLKDALAEATARWSWDRGDRLLLREIGSRKDVLHVYAVRRSSRGVRVWNGYVPETAYSKSLDHICSIDLNVVAGIDVVGVGVERQIFEHDQAKRPEGARMERRK